MLMLVHCVIYEILTRVELATLFLEHFL